jgi:hypothetical protein
MPITTTLTRPCRALAATTLALCLMSSGSALAIPQIGDLPTRSGQSTAATPPVRSADAGGAARPAAAPVGSETAPTGPAAAALRSDDHGFARKAALDIALALLVVALTLAGALRARRRHRPATPAAR